ncbi:MAG: hypothetical protein P8Y42_22600 [Exilibacterium sp.]
MTDAKARFAKAIDSLFIQLGREAVYRPVEGTPFPIRVIARRPEKVFDLGEGRIHAEDPQLEFRVSEVASPSRGEHIEFDELLYRIEAEPRLELHHLVWVVDALSVNL